MQLLVVLALQVTLIWAANDTEVTDFVSSNKPRTGFFSKVVDTILYPIDKIFHINQGKITDDKAAKQPTILQTVVGGIEEPIKVIADKIDSMLRPIYPGTRWCGKGDRASSSKDLGLFIFTDQCCREHDNCPDNMSAHGSKHGLTNTGTFTRSHCDCDERFHSCLKKANTIVSNELGKAYFNVLRPMCYKKEHPIIRCNMALGIIWKRCERYELNMEEPEVWQWFDAKEY
ncbi:Phospholipase A2 [Blattella germanica]|nr:Phospholipase A2 [Blattella germanica]